MHCGLAGGSHVLAGVHLVVKVSLPSSNSCPRGQVYVATSREVVMVPPGALEGGSIGHGRTN